MADISTLVTDIYRTMEEGTEVPESLTKAFGEELSKLIEDRLSGEGQEFRIRPSNLGEKCLRRLWYQAKMPEKAQKLKGQDLLKFLLGDIFEAVILYLAEASGHTVTGKQDTVSLHGVSGSRDSVIDGMVVDAKSASPFSWQKFAEGLTVDKDAFGYLDQIEFYRQASQDDPLVTNKEQAAFLAGEKVLGKLTLDIHGPKGTDFDAKISAIKEVLSLSTPPGRGYSPEPYGKSGNESLPVKCNYCEFRKTCWPGARTFLYSSGPVHFTKIVKEPNVSEVFE
jgi:hypothetical protein